MQKILIILAIVWGWIFLPINASAMCTCTNTDDTLAHALDASDIVFVGKADQRIQGYYGANIHATEFSITQRIKGISSGVTTIAIATPEKDEDCDLVFWEGRDYLVYATLDKYNLYRVSICGRTSFLSGSESEVQDLEKLANNNLRLMPIDTQSNLLKDSGTTMQQLQPLMQYNQPTPSP